MEVIKIIPTLNDILNINNELKELKLVAFEHIDSKKIYVDSTFVHVNFNKLDIKHGWKLHISSIKDTMLPLLSLVVKFCLRKEISFKYIYKEETLLNINSKYSNRGSSGKFITIFPSGTEEFKMIVRELYDVLEGFKGPYILSDKRYKDSQVIYYRYGRIGLKSTINYKGEEKFIIDGPNGEHFIDEPKAYYDIPSWVEDPLETDVEDIEDIESSDLGLKSGRYTIKSVLQMNNSGGVYLADDNYTQKQVVIKESRPHVDAYGDYDSIKLKQHEKEMYLYTKNFNFIPNYIDDFYDWEHFYLVIEYIEGTVFSDYVAGLNMLINSERDKMKYLEDFKMIFLNLVENIVNLHNFNFSFGDISNGNLIIKDSTVFLIDLELSNTTENTFFNDIATKGYRLRQKDYRKLNRFNYDKQAIGLLMFNYFNSNNILIEYDNNAPKKILNSLLLDGYMTQEIKILIEESIYNDDFTVNEILSSLKNLDIYLPSVTKFDGGNLHLHDWQFNSMMMQCLKSDYEIKHKSELQLFTGKLGILTISKRLGLNNNNINCGKLLRLINDLSNENIGLAEGNCGTSIGLYELGFEKEGINLFENIITTGTNTFKNMDFSIYFGLSGLGLTSIYFYKQTSDEKYLRYAEKIGDYLLGNKSAVFSQKETGFYKGITGNSYFLSKLEQISENDKYLDFSTQLIDLVYKSSRKIDDFVFTPIKIDSLNFSPYLDGAGGLLRACLEVYRVNNDIRYISYINSILGSINYKYVKSPIHSKGISGIGLFLIDLYYVTNNKKYLDLCSDLIIGVLNFKSIDKDSNQFLIPNDKNNHSLIDGLAGVIHFIFNYNNSINKELKGDAFNEIY